MTEGKTTTPQVAVWYFVAATFVFAAPVLFFRDNDTLWMPIVTLIVGFALVVLGGIQFSRELRDRSRRRSGEQPPPA